jgi:hypothetical protein
MRGLNLYEFGDSEEAAAAAKFSKHVGQSVMAIIVTCGAAGAATALLDVSILSAIWVPVDSVVLALSAAHEYLSFLFAQMRANTSR